MRFVRWIIFGLIVASLGGGLGASQDEGGNEGGWTSRHSTGKKRPRADQKGEYVLSVTGGFNGKGTVVVTSTVSLQVKVTGTGNTSGTLTANNMAINGSYFTGSG